MALQALDALQQGTEVGVEVPAGESSQCHFQIHPGIGGLTHIHQGGPQYL